jgi:hypothetical protein
MTASGGLRLFLGWMVYVRQLVSGEGALKQIYGGDMSGINGDASPFAITVAEF